MRWFNFTIQGLTTPITALIISVGSGGFLGISSFSFFVSIVALGLTF